MASMPFSGDGFDRTVVQIPSCSLDETGMRDQRARYDRLAAGVTRIQREPDSLSIEFDRDLDRETLDETLARERECCPFFRFAFDEQARQLQVTVSEAGMLPALDAIAHALGGASS